MCFLETASVAGAVRRRDEPPIDNDQELAANGIACLAGSFFRAMPSAGGFSQTAINQRAGARTQLSELVTALLAVACALFLGGVLSDLPQATLGLHGGGRGGRADPAVRAAPVLAPRPHRVLGRRRHRRGRAGARAAASRARRGRADPVPRAARARPHRRHRAPADPRRATMCGFPGRARRRCRACSCCAATGRSTRPTSAASTAGCSPLSTPATPDTLVLDMSAVARTPLTVVDRFADLEAELGTRGVRCWIAALPPSSLDTARQLPRWEEMVASRPPVPDRPRRRPGVPRRAVGHAGAHTGRTVGRRTGRVSAAMSDRRGDRRGDGMMRRGARAIAR